MMLLSGRRFRHEGWAVLVVLTTFASAAGATTFPAVGGVGDRAEVYTCPAGYVLVGFNGRTGAWIDRIGLICSMILSPDYKTGYPMSPPPKGGNGGSPSDQYCEPDAAIRSVKVTQMFQMHHTGITSNMTPYTISRIEFSCVRPANGQTVASGVFGAGLEDDRFGNIFQGTDAPFTHRCPGQEYATGLNIRYGKHVNAIGLICGPVVARRRP
jgi:hypothetical protein